MPSLTCRPCKDRRNLIDRLRRSGKPTNLKRDPCASCRQADRLYVRKQKVIKTMPDEQMVYRLMGGPESAATQRERREAIRQLLLAKPRLSNADIAERVGVTSRTVERVAAAQRRGTV